MNIWWERRNAKFKPRDRRLDYYWQGQREKCPTAYVALQRIREKADARELATAAIRCRRSRKIVFSNLVLPIAPSVTDANLKTVSLIWDELFPLDGERRPTHFLEIGITTDPKTPRSPFLQTALNLDNSDRDLGYCAGEIGGFLRWGLLQWSAEDFIGLSLDKASGEHLWLYQCLFAEWKRLRRS